MTAQGEKFDGYQTTRRGCGSRHYARTGDAGPRCDRDPVVARDDRPEQRRRGQARQRFQCIAERLQGRSDLQGQLRRHAERRDRRLPRRQCAGHHAGVRGRNRDHDGGQGRHQAGLPAHEGAGRAVRSQHLSAGDHRILLDLERRDAVIPVQLVKHGDVGQPRCAEEGRDRRAAEDLAGGVCRCQKAARHQPDLRLLLGLDHLGPDRTVLRMAQRADRHQGQRPRRLRYRARIQHAAGNQAAGESRRTAEGQELRLLRDEPTPAKGALPPANVRCS